MTFERGDFRDETVEVAYSLRRIIVVAEEGKEGFRRLWLDAPEVFSRIGRQDVGRIKRPAGVFAIANMYLWLHEAPPQAHE